MKKIIISILILLISISSVNATIKQVNFNTKFEKENKNQIQNHQGFPIHNYKVKRYNESKPIQELTKDKDYSDFKDDYDDRRRNQNLYVKYDYIAAEKIYKFQRNTQYTNIQKDKINYQNQNRYKIDKFKKQGKTYTNSEYYSLNYFH